MLVRLFGENFRSLRDPFELSMVAADLKREEDGNRGVISVKITGLSKPLKLLRAVGIFGPNASGKSTVINAANALGSMVELSSIAFKPSQPIPWYGCFGLDNTNMQKPTKLGCDVVHDKSILRYEVKFERNRIVSEKLSQLNSNGTVLIERNDDEKITGELIDKSEVNQLYVKNIQPTVYALSKLAQHGPAKGKESALPYFQSILNSLRSSDYQVFPWSSPHSEDSAIQLFVSNSEFRNWAMEHLIRKADLGIFDVKIVKKKVKVPVGSVEGKLVYGFVEKDVIQFVHQGKVSQAIDFSAESAGTQKLLYMAKDWWMLSKQSTTLFADELSASLHPKLLGALVRSFNAAPASNTSQLIFATHDMQLLENDDELPPPLRRDQVYFTRKDSEGATELYSLAEFKDGARPVHNLRKRYLSGRYGAVPMPEKLL